MERPAQRQASELAPRRILIVRLGAIGDCLRVLPSLARLREAFPAAEIGWAVESLSAPLLVGHPSISRLHVVDRRAMRASAWSAWGELRRVGRELAEARYDVAIDFHTRIKSGYLTMSSRAPRRIGFDRASGTEANFLFTNCHVNLRDHYENRVLRFGRLLSPLGLEMDRTSSLGVWVAPDARASARATYDAAGRPDVAIFPGTSARRSQDRWSAAKWRETLARLGDAGLTSMVLWGPGEMEAAAETAGATAASSISPPTTLVEMMALLGCFRLYVGANTGALHMAWMQGVPSVVLAGGRPWRTDAPLPPVPSAMLSAGGVEPARKLRGEAARRAVEGIDVEEVVASALRLLA